MEGINWKTKATDEVKEEKGRKTKNTKVTTNSVTWVAGNHLTGATSGAKGYVAGASSGTTGYLTGVTGTFAQAEALLASDGSTFATTTAAYAYNFSDVKQLAGGGFTADVGLDVKVALPGSGPILSAVSGGNATVTATLSNFVSQLRLNDIVEFSNNNASHKAKVTAITDNYNFNMFKRLVVDGGTRPKIKETWGSEIQSFLRDAFVDNPKRPSMVDAVEMIRDQLNEISPEKVNIIDTSQLSQQSFAGLGNGPVDEDYLDERNGCCSIS